MKHSNAQHRLSSYSDPGRRGAILVAAMVCLAVAAVIFVAIAKTAATCRRLGEVQAWQAQAAWLAESAVERAAARLAADAGYTGEIWTLSAAEFGGADGAVVAINVEPIPETPGRRTVRCRADYPNHPHHRCREVRRVVVSLTRIIRKGCLRGVGQG